MSSEAYREKRKVLRGLSQVAKEMQEEDFAECSINEILIEHFYKTEIHQTFETLFNWNKKGFKVKKGETAFVIWGKPKQITATEKKEDIEEDENEFYPLCYLFSNAQVVKKDA